MMTRSVVGNRSRSFSASRHAAYLVAVVVCAVLAQLAMVIAVQQYQAEALISVSEHMKRQKLYSRGYDAALQSVSLYPFTGYGYYYAADHAALLARPQEAARLLIDAEPWMPHLPQLLRFRGQILFHQGDYTGAATALTRYLNMDPEPAGTLDQFVNLLGQSFYRSNQPAAAAFALNRAENFPANRATAERARAINSVMLRQPAMALALMRRCAPASDGDDPVDPRELFSAAASAERLDTMSEVLERYRRERNLSHAMGKVLALSYVKVGRKSDALMLLQLLAGQTPEDQEVWLLLGDVSIEMERRDWAASFYKEHMRRQPDSPFAPQIEAKLGTPP